MRKQVSPYLKWVASFIDAVILCVPFFGMFFSHFLWLDSAHAQSSSFTYEGRLYSSSGVPLLESVDVKFQILNPAGNCVLYEEVQSSVDLSSSKGAFSLGVGSAVGDTKRSANFRGAYNPSMISVFRNSATLSGIPAAGCAAGTYVAGASDTRLLRVQVTKGSTTETLSPDLVINTVPSAQVAASLQGFLPSDFLRLDVANGISGNIGLTATGTGAGQTREFRFYELAASGVEYSAFKAPDAMAMSLTYVLPSAAPAAGDVLKATVPSSGLVTLSWGADAGAGGGISNFNGSNQSSQSFTAVDIAAVVTAPAWSTNTGTGAHTLQIPMASGAGVTGGLITKTEHTAFSSKVDRAGDTMTGLLNFTGATGVSLAGTSGITFTGTGTIAMGTNKITGVGDPTANQEAATKAYVDSQSSGKISGTLTATRIPYASGASTLADSANFTYLPATGAMTIGGTAPSITSNDAITIAAGGTNRNVVLAPSGTGFTLLNGNVGVGTAAPLDTLSIATAPVASATRALVNVSNTALAAGSANGTYVGANPAAFTGNFIDLQVGGVRQFSVSSAGVITGNGSGITGVSGTLSGLTAGRVPLSATATSISDSANFTFNATTGAMGVNGTAPSITSGDAITIAAGGTNKNVVLTPSGTGFTLLNGNVGIGTASPGASIHILNNTNAGTYGILEAQTTGNGAYKHLSFRGNGTEYGYISNLQLYMNDLNAGGGAVATVTSRGTASKSSRVFGHAFNGSSIGVVGVSSGAVANGSAGVVGIGIANPGVQAESTGTINDALVVYSRSLTSGRLAYFEHSTSALTGDALQMNLGQSGGSFSGNFINLQNNSASKFVVTSDGNVGIGTTSPTTALDVSGAFNFREMAAPALSSMDQGRIYFDGTANKFRVSENGGAYVDLVGGSGGISGLTSGRVPFASSSTAIADDANLVWDNTNKRLGVGTASPSYRLHVSGTGGIVLDSGKVGINTPPSAFSYDLAVNNGMVVNGGAAVFYGGVDTTSVRRNGAETLYLSGTHTSHSGASVHVYGESTRTLTAGTSQTLVTSSTFAPTSGSGVFNFLQIDATVNQTGGANGVSRGLYINPTLTSAADFRALETVSGNVILGSTSGNVGIGTISPSAKLDLDANLPGAGIARIRNQSGTGYGLQVDLSGNSNPGYYVLDVRSNSVPRFAVQADGNVGIGTTSPGALLQLGTAGTSLGTMRLTGNTSGFVQVQPAAAAGSWTMTLPPNDGNSGQVLQTDGNGVTSWAAAGGGGSASGTAGHLQFSDGSSGFSSDANQLFWDSTNNRLGVRTGTPAAAFNVVDTGMDWRIHQWQFGLWNAFASWDLTASGMPVATVSYQGRIGILEDSPDAKLEISNDGGAEDLLMLSSNDANDGDRLIVKSTGRVGLGVVNPTYGIHLAPTSGLTAAQTMFIQDATAATGATSLVIRSGASQAGTNLTVWQNNGGSTMASISQNGDFVGTNAVVAPTVLSTDNYSALTSAGVVIGGTGSVLGFTNASQYYATRDTALSRIAAGTLAVGTGAHGNSAGTLIAGNVGIGTTSPAGKLDILSQTVGNADHYRFTLESGNPGDPYAGGFATGNPLERMTVTFEGGTHRQALQFSDAGGASDTIFAVSSSVDSGSTWQSRLNVRQDGNVGIGTTSPSEKLHLSMDGETRVFIDAYGTSNQPSIVGRMARGTTAAPTATQLNDVILTVGGRGYGATTFPVFSRGDFRIVAGENWSDSAHGTYLTFRTTQNGTVSNTEKMRIDGAGNVGIGDTSPDTTLKVVGSLCVKSDQNNCSGSTAGTIYANTTTITGADYAEYFLAEEEAAPGSLVGLNPNTGLARKYRSGDKLLGIASTNPGTVGNADIQNKKSILVALMGQVPFNRSEVNVRNNEILTQDNHSIGYLLANGNVYVNVGSTNYKRAIQSLQEENLSMKSYLCQKDPLAPFCR